MPEIVKASECDLETILSLQKLAYRSEAEIYDDHNIQPLTQTLADLEDEARESVVLKALENGAILGSVRATAKDGTCYVNKLIVHPDCQNQGLGRQLLAAIEKCCPAARYELFTGFRSLKNLALYEKTGYVRFKTVKVADTLELVYLEKV